MTYKVVPFIANVANIEGSKAAAEQLESLVNSMAASGWVYLRLETVETYIAGTNGCFGFGAESGRMTSFKMAVFRKA